MIGKTEFCLFLLQETLYQQFIVLATPPPAPLIPPLHGSSLSVFGFVVFSLTLGTITHDVEALVVSSFGPDSILLDNSVMSIFGAVFD